MDYFASEGKYLVMNHKWAIYLHFSDFSQINSFLDRTSKVGPHSPFSTKMRLSISLINIVNICFEGIRHDSRKDYPFKRLITNKSLFLCINYFSKLSLIITKNNPKYKVINRHLDKSALVQVFKYMA
jgi:hypothetical protein